MPIVQRAPAWRHLRPWLSAVAVMGLVLGALAGPVLAQQGQHQTSDGIAATRLRDPRVSPRIARSSTTIRFSVTYWNSTGSAPAYVRVLIDGRPRAMTVAGSSDSYRRGVRYTYASKLPVGRHRVRFEAMSNEGTAAMVPGGAIRIAARSSAGGSTGGSSAGGGTTGGGSTVASSGGASAGSSGSDPSGWAARSGADPSGRAGGGSDAPAGATPNDADTLGGGHPGSINLAPGAAADVGEGSSDPAVPSVPTVGPVEPAPRVPDGAVDGAEGLAAPSAGDAKGASPLAEAAAPLAPGGFGNSDGSAGSAAGRGSDGLRAAAIDLSWGNHGLFDGALRAYPVMVTTTGTVVVWAAFVFFGKRRRDGEPPASDPVLAAHAAAAQEPLAVAALVPPTATQQRIPPGADPTEAGMPRWRRPSLIQARKTDPLRSATTFASLTFADGAVEPFEGMERRRIRYRLVRLMDVPDEVRANEIGIVDEGDEVQVIDADGAYRLVLCPDGQQGWLHRMVLGDLVDEDSVAPAPDGIDEDVLAAFLSSRHQESA